MQNLPIPIIRTKLYPPPMAPDTIQRQRLLSLAQSAEQSPLTLVSAPAGYGKSTLVSQWLDLLGCESAWLSLDRGESELTQFLSYVVAALRNTYPGCCAEIAEVLQSAVLPDVHSLAGIFCNEIDAYEETMVLILDDYHQLSSPEVDNFLDTVLKHPPQNMHLVIVSRRDPSLSLHALRARGALCEVRLGQLRFREGETRAFMSLDLGDTIADDEIRVLHQRTEGWPVALRLARLATAKTSSKTSIVDRLPEDSHAVRVYLMQEVLAGQPAGVREYLLRIAFLDRFCAELCEAVMPEDSAGISGKEFVNHINQSNLFSIPLDVSKEWFRFHHLFQSLLQDLALTRLGKEEIRDVHTRASEWFEGHEFLGEAIRHALSAGKANEAADVISRHRNNIMNHERWHQLGIWLRSLPPKIVASRPGLQLLKARRFMTTGQYGELVRSLDHAESLLDTTDIEDKLERELHGSLVSMRCFQRYLESDGERSVRTARRALELLAPENLAERGFAMIILAAGLQMTGDVNEAKDAIYSAMTEDSARGDDGVTYMSRLLVSLCFVYWMDANLVELELTAKDTMEITERMGLLEVFSIGVHFRVATYFEQNRLSTIEDYLQKYFRKKTIANPQWHGNNLILHALTQEVLGNSEQALRTAESLHSFALQTHNRDLINVSEALFAELALRQGRMADSLRWAKQYDPEPLMPMFTYLEPPMCLARILVRDDSAASHKRAQALLSRLQDYLTGIHNKRFLIETLVLRALLSDKTGDTATAVKQLDKAVSMAQPGGFIRLFVDTGPGLMPLLHLLQVKGEKLEYVGRILAAFQAESGQTSPAQQDMNAGVTVRDIAGLPEQLSRREKEVLALLVERLTNKEIGERLFISTATVKRHAHNIYEKLNVKSRREAVTKAVALGLITD